MTFQYWDWAPVWRAWWGAGQPALRPQPNVSVRWEIAADYWTKLQVAIAGDTAPNSWRMNSPPNLPQWSSPGPAAGSSRPTSPGTREAGAAVKAMAPVIQEYTNRDGKQWAMPFGQAISGIIAYNEEVVRAAGPGPARHAVDRPGGWTWSTLQEYAVRLTRRRRLQPRVLR